MGADRQRPLWPPLDSIRGLTIFGVPGKPDILTVNLAAGDLAALAQGIFFAGQAQKIFASAPASVNNLGFRGTIENVIGAPHADWIKGNASANHIEGRG